MLLKLPIQVIQDCRLDVLKLWPTYMGMNFDTTPMIQNGSIEIGILSAGHGSMALYSALHLAGFDVTLDDIKSFRQLRKATGHPEYGEAEGVETTTGPLGQGVATAIGMALGMKKIIQNIYPKQYPII